MSTHDVIEKNILSKTGHDQTLHSDANYIDFLHGIKTRLKAAQLKTARAVNHELVAFYWELGKDLIERQKKHLWGDYFLDQISHDMRSAFPEMQGFSKRNLSYMRQLAAVYPEPTFVQQAVAQLPWGHICLLIHQIKDKQTREWYAQQTLKNGWSRAVLGMQIETQLYELL